ncbi:MAG: flagellar hook-length control protein FliK [Gammaproteobacteria bacterium]|nr:flagellar hook-length control protein FliK [Gammaproteobacteria bacterium]
MAELALLVNSTDAALLNGSVAAPVAANGAVAGGFANVLGKRLMQSESAVAKESSSPMDEVRSVPVTETGEAQPANGQPLPPAVPQNTAHKPETTETGNPILDASLLSAIAQGSPAANGQTVNTSLAATINPVLDSVRAGREGVPQSTLSQRAITRQGTENSTLSTALNTTLSSSATTLSQQNVPSTLTNVRQDAQQASATPILPSMLGKPISATAQQALVRASLNAGKAHSLRADMLSATGLAVANTPYNSGLSSTLNGVNSPVGSTMRVDIFVAAMGAATQAGVNIEPRLSTTSTSTTAPVSLLATSDLSDDTNNVFTGLPRLPGAPVGGALPILTVPTPVGQPAWASELGQRVTWLANSELREAQLQLNPRSLGAVDVRIVYGPDQQLSVSFSAANPVARDALESSLPRLREMFEQQGLHLADANISHESPAEREQRSGMSNESLTMVDGYIEDEVLTDAAGAHSAPSRWLTEGMLDAYA